MSAKKAFDRFYFRKNGVVVKVPPQAKLIKATRPDIPAGIPMKAAKGKFQPLRLVINLKMVEAGGAGAEVLKFNPPIVIRVRYYATDLANAKKAGGLLSLGVWDGTKWMRFTKKKHFFRLEQWEKKKGKGWATIEISGWGDPTIGLGK